MSSEILAQNEFGESRFVLCQMAMKNKRGKKKREPVNAQQRQSVTQLRGATKAITHRNLISFCGTSILENNQTVKICCWHMQFTVRIISLDYRAGTELCLKHRKR